MTLPKERLAAAKHATINPLRMTAVTRKGEQVEALVLTKEDKEGRLLLSKKRAQYERAWGDVERIKDEDGVVTGTVIEVVKGGLILDIGLPDTNGLELCKTIRRTHSVPVIFLTARTDEIDRIVGLEIGADDYVTKPFKFPVLLARLRAQLRTHEQSEDAVFQLGPYTFKPSMKMLITEDDRKIRLTRCHAVCSLSAAKPSMVVTCLPCTCFKLVRQALVGSPSTCMVQAPHRPAPQPYLVPVRPNISLIAQSTGILGSASKV